MKIKRSALQAIILFILVGCAIVLYVILLIKEQKPSPVKFLIPIGLAILGGLIPRMVKWYDAKVDEAVDED